MVSDGKSVCKAEDCTVVGRQRPAADEGEADERYFDPFLSADAEGLTAGTPEPPFGGVGLRSLLATG